jgi:hypothetical protein
MHWYKKIIKAGPLREEIVYKSIRKINKPHSSRCLGRKSKSSEKQRLRNLMECKRRVQRLICNNFTTKDLYITLTFREDISDEDCQREFTNFVRRCKNYCKKHMNKDFKYIGCTQRGEKKGRWHAHVVISYIEFNILRDKLWKKGGIKIEGLYEDGAYERLAKYITSEKTGKRQMKQSRNLVKPTERVIELSSTAAIVRRIKKGQAMKQPKGYLPLLDQCYTHINDITGESVRMVYINNDFLYGGGRYGSE